MQKNEQAFINKFQKFVVDHPEHFSHTFVYEAKYCKEKRFPLSKIYKHQIDNLWLANQKRIIYKIPDDSYAQKPFDGFYMVKVAAYLVIMFHRRGNKTFYMVHIDNVKYHMLHHKSLTEEDCGKLGFSFNFS